MIILEFLVDILCTFEAEFIHSLVKYKWIKEGIFFNLKVRYIDDVLSINHPNFANWTHLERSISSKPNKDRHNNYQKKKDIKTNNDMENTT